jgi:hypothetical protein
MTSGGLPGKINAAMFGLLSRLVVVVLAALAARRHARDFVRGYIQKLVRVRLRSALTITVAQIAALAATALVVHRCGDPLAGRLVGSALVWFLLAFNLVRFFGSTLPEIVEARRYLAGPAGYVIRGMLGISVARELIEMDLLVLAVCLIVGLDARLEVSSAFHLVAPWQELLASAAR